MSHQSCTDQELDELLGKLPPEPTPTILKIRPNNRGRITLGPNEIGAFINAIQSIKEVQMEMGATLMLLAHAFRSVEYAGGISGNDATAFAAVSSAQAQRARNNVALLLTLIN